MHTLDQNVTQELVSLSVVKNTIECLWTYTAKRTRGILARFKASLVEEGHSDFLMQIINIHSIQ